MLIDFINIQKNLSTPLWEQLYSSLKNNIEADHLHYGEKLPSIRETASFLRISRTTVETAYNKLCMEGYLEAKPQSGYHILNTNPRKIISPIISNHNVLYDFTTSSIDSNAADLENWRKQMRSVLADENSIISYGDPQGEAALRNAISSYIFRVRGVSADPKNIFIGAGTGPLIQLLCTLFPNKPPVYMECSGFDQAELIFGDYGYSVKVSNNHSPKTVLSDLPNLKSAIITELPSLRPRGNSSFIANRRSLLKIWLSKSNDRYVLEDDYNGELHYKNRPLPAFQSLCPNQTIYLGSFSKLLLPSVRIAFMVLPEKLSTIASLHLSHMNQTAGKTEQLALASYIHMNLLEKHLRRLRRLYLKKYQLMIHSLNENFSNKIHIVLHETSLAFLLTIFSNCKSEDLLTAANHAKISCRPFPQQSGRYPQILLGFSGIPLEEIPNGVHALANAWKKFL